MIQARSRFGQNFLIEKSIISRIIESLKISPDDNIIEIGPGKGALTEKLVESNCTLSLVEIDRDLVDILRKKYHGLSIVNEDILKVEFNALFGGEPKRIIGNLPYNISTPLLFKLSSINEWIIDMHIMLQKEVAERIVSNPSKKEYGRLSVSMQLFWEATSLFDFHDKGTVILYFAKSSLGSCLSFFLKRQDLLVRTQSIFQFREIV